MSVPRYTTAYGNRYRYRNVTVETRTRVSSSSPWSLRTNVYTQNVAYSVRLHPVKGEVRPSGFRMPTLWGMHAANTQETGFDFIKADYPGQQWLKGNGSFSTMRYLRHQKVTLSADAVIVSIDGNLRNRCATEARQKVADGKISVGLAVAESKLTLALLVELVTKLVKVIRAVRRGRWSEAGKILGYRTWKDTKGLSDSWLQYQYGLKPLISDIYGAQEQLKAGFREKEQTFKVSRQLRQALVPQDFVVPATDPDIWTNDAKFIANGKAFEIIKFVYFMKVSDASLHALAQLGLVNPAVIAWELVPFSFVIDWLLPIGNFLDGATATLGTTFIAGYEDRLISADLTLDRYFLNFVSGDVGKHSLKQYSFQRIPLFTPVLPMLPHFKNPFSTTHVISAAALVRSLSR